MANIFEKFKMKSAIDTRTKLNLDSTHITTTNWMTPSVIFSKEMVPSEKINIHTETFTRLSPLAVPTFGRANIYNRAFFVPFRTIFPAWNDFITDTKHVWEGSTAASTVTNVPVVSNDVLVTSLLNNAYVASATSADTYDIAARVSTGNTNITYYKLRPTGRKALKLIESLGYKINWDVRDTTVMSLLPLLAYAKVIMDWYWSAQYATTLEYDSIIKLFTTNSGVLDYTRAGMDVGFIINACLTNTYDGSYLTSAWDNPVAPTTNSFSNITLPDIQNDYPFSASVGSATIVNGNYASNTRNSNGTPTLYATTPSGNELELSYRLNQYMLEGLKKLTDWMKRNQLSGTRAMERYLARYGKQLSPEKLNRSVYLGTQEIPIQFGDVTSQADTDGASLGQLAGKGLGYSNDGNFSYETEEFGIIIIINTVQPKVGYYQGQNRNTMHVTKTDYFQPEFDSLGTQAISAREAYVPMDVSGLTSTSGLTNVIFGYTPRYAEYKIGYDMVTGDYRYKSTGVGKNAWHLMREFDSDSFGNNVNNIKHSLNFVKTSDNAQYNRIFQQTGEKADNFDMIHQFSIETMVPMKPLYETYEFDNKGEDILMDANGAKVN